MKWMAKMIIALVSAQSPFSIAADEIDFFSQVEEQTTFAPVDDTTDISINGEIDYRIHYAIDKQQNQYAFLRNKRSITSSRLDGYLKLLYQPDNKFNIQLSILGSYDSKIHSEKSDVDIDESFIYWKPSPNWHLTVGRQLMVLGESSYFQVLDVINPLDRRVLGLAELDETRLPIFGSRISYGTNRWGADLFVIHEFRPSKTDETRGDFDPFIIFGGDKNVQFSTDPRPLISNPDWGIRFFLSKPWGDINIVIADTHQYDATPIDFKRDKFVVGYPAIKVAGFTMNYIKGNWLLKGEYGYQRGGRFLRNDIDQQLATNILSLVVAEEKTQQKMVIGGRYSGINNLTLDIEFLSTKINGYQSILTSNRINNSAVLDLNYEILNNRIQIGILWMHWQQQKSDLARLRIDYEWLDELTLHAGYINYITRDQSGRLRPYDQNDRIFVGTSYSF